MALSVAIAAVFSAPAISEAQTSYPCWIGYVKSSGDGVDVYFRPPRTVALLDGNQSRTYEIGGGDARPSLPDTPNKVFFVHARLGNKLFTHNGPEDSCTMEVVSRDGRLGIDAHTAFHVLGLPSSDASVFVPAE